MWLKKLFKFVVICLFIGLFSCKQPVAVLETNDKRAVSSSLDEQIRKSKIEDIVFDAVDTRARKTKMPALITRQAVIALFKEKKLSPPLWKWSNLNGFQVAFLPFEDVENLKSVAERNEEILISNKKSKFDRPNKLDSNTGGASLSAMANQLSQACFTGIKSKIDRKNDISITISSGGPISIIDSCRLYAWAFAANGIAFEPDESKPNTIILKWADQKTQP